MDRAIIIAGGKGERLRPYTEDRPKAMIPVLGNPLLSFQLRLLSSHGFKKIAICCGYRNEVLKEHFGDGSKFGVHIDYLVEDEPLGRGGALRRALEHVQAHEPVVAMNGDSLTNINLSDLTAFHKKYHPAATLVTVPLRSPYGIIDVKDDNLVGGFTEKPELPFWINAGIYVLDPRIVDDLPIKGDHEELTFPKLAQANQLRVYKTRAFWKTIDTVKDLTEVRSEFEQLVFGAFLQSGALGVV
ncbi:MAG TPA: nucleotidyltransferase family protein [Planktothrix sp.]